MESALNLLPMIAVGLLHLAAFAAIGLVVGLAWRGVRNRRRTTSQARSKRSCFAFVAIGIPVAALSVLLLLYLLTRAGAPAPGRPNFWRMVAVTYDSKSRTWVCRDLVELRLETCHAPPDVEPPAGWNRTSEQPNGLGWSMMTTRRIPAPVPARRLVYAERIPLPAVPLPPVAKNCLANDVLVPIPAVVVLRVPRYLVRAVDPPVKSTHHLPGGLEEIELVRLAQNDITLEVTHPWLRNELGNTVLAWNLWRVVNWLILVVVAIFADRVKVRLLRLFARLKRPHPRADAGFKPPPR